MNFNAGERKPLTDDIRELTETELRTVAGGFGSFGGLALRRAVEIYLEQQRIEALYADRI